MPRKAAPRLSEKEVAALERAEEWKMFRRNHMFTQRRLAQMIGVSRRTIQQVENGYITPHQQTVRLFEAFKRKHTREKFSIPA